MTVFSFVQTNAISYKTNLLITKIKFEVFEICRMHYDKPPTRLYIYIYIYIYMRYFAFLWTEHEVEVHKKDRKKKNEANIQPS